MFSVLEKLNLDIVFTIKTFLSFEDTVRLALTCKQFHEWLHEEAICRYTVQHDAGYTFEAQEARAGRCTYLQAFERIYRRKAAISTAKPYSIRAVGYGTALQFCSGTLSWLSEDGSVFLMNTHESSTITKRFDIGSVVRESLTDSGGPMRLLSGLGNIVVVTVESRLSKWTWLVAIEHGDDRGEFPRIIAKRKIRSGRNIFARQSTKQLVYGFQTTRNPCREESTWQVNIIELNTPYRENVDDEQNPAFHRFYPGFGITLGRDVDFAIHEGYLYAVSTRLAAKLVDGDWTSFYECIWMPLSVPMNTPSDTIATPQNVRWELIQIHRRCGSEGPINDAWTSLRLEPDEATNQLMIVETRREWVNGLSQQIRSCYVQPLHRPSESASLSGMNKSFHHRRSAPAAEDAHAFLHHDTTPAHTPPISDITSTKFSSYNPSSKSFLDLTTSDGTLHLQLSSGANIPIPPYESVRAGITAHGRQEDLIFHSKATAPRSCPIASLQYLQEMTTMQTCLDGRSEGVGSRVVGELTVTAATDERCVVVMCGSKGDEDKPIVLVSFEPIMT